jgi:hypothetical protein
MTDSYSKLKYDVEFRKQVVEKVGLGFELPSANTVVGPNVRIPGDGDRQFRAIMIAIPG